MDLDDLLRALESQKLISSRHQFEESGWASGESMRAIGSEVVRLLSRAAAHNTSKSSGEVGCLIICALTEERNEVRNAINNGRAGETDETYRGKYGFRFERIEYKGVSFALVVQPEQGMTVAASLTARAVIALEPKLVVMPGICAGRKDKVKAGEVVIATHAVNYSAGKQVEGGSLLPRNHPKPLLPDISEYVFSTFDMDKARKEIAERWASAKGSSAPCEPMITTGMMGCSTGVVTDSKVMVDAASIQDELIAIDMESYGIAVSATHLNKPWIVVKAVQDYGGTEKTEMEEAFRSYAAFASAVVAGEFAVGYISR